MELIITMLSFLLGAGLIGIFAIFGIVVLLLFAIKGLIAIFKWLFGIKKEVDKKWYLYSLV